MYSTNTSTNTKDHLQQTTPISSTNDTVNIGPKKNNNKVTDILA